MGKRLTYLVFILAVLLVSSVWMSKVQAFELEKEVVEYKLSNGMRWLFVKRDQAPVFSGIVMIRAGSDDEPAGKTGIAHMFEHMAFKGSKLLGTRDWKNEKKVLDKIAVVGKTLTEAMQAQPRDEARIVELKNELNALEQERLKYAYPGEVTDLLQQNGAEGLNAYTALDETAFMASMPINRLELWAAVFSEMIGDTVYRSFYTERDVVVEERRMRIDDDPNGQLSKAILEYSFQNGPYRRHPIGKQEEIESFEIADAKKFKKEHYTPDRMVGVIVGDIDIDKTKRIVKKYFGKFPKGTPAKQPQPQPNTGGGTHTLELDAQPSIVMTWHKPTLPDPVEYSFDVASSILCDGPTSRLYKELVIDKKLALNVWCGGGYPGALLPNVFLVWIEIMNGSSAQEIMDVVQKQLDELKSTDVKPEELERVRTKISAVLLFSLEDNSRLAGLLAEYEAKFNDWELLADYPENVSTVTAEDIRALAKKYFTDENRTVIIRQRRGSGKPGTRD
jgi:predicted Zn-dependent peptidase